MAGHDAARMPRPQKSQQEIPGLMTASDYLDSTVLGHLSLCMYLHIYRCHLRTMCSFHVSRQRLGISSCTELAWKVPLRILLPSRSFQFTFSFHTRSHAGSLKLKRPWNERRRHTVQAGLTDKVHMSSTLTPMSNLWKTRSQVIKESERF